MYYQRKIHPALKKHLAKKQITVLTGMRRTGKTTIVKQLLAELVSDNKMYFDLERIDNRELFSEKNYDSIIYTLKQRGLNFDEKVYLILDEIQLVKNIPSVLKYLYDNYNIKFIATGSSSFYIKNLFTESLAGRKKIFELYPLDFGEFLSFKKVIHQSNKNFAHSFNAAEYERLKLYYEDFINYGGFPEVALATNVSDKKDLLSDIISSYINIDIKSLSDFHHQRDIYALIKMLAGRVGTRLDYTKLSRLIGLSRPTIQNYIDFFEKTYLLTRLPVFTQNPDREIVKAQKLYFCDNGIINILSKINSGSKFENAVFCQLRHYGNLRYYALKNGREIDFILDEKIALECKELPTESDKKDLKGLANLAKIKKHYLIGRHQTPRFNDYVWGGEIL